MDVLKRIDEIMRKQHLNDYQLSKLSGLSTSTISNMGSGTPFRPLPHWNISAILLI